MVLALPLQAEDAVTDWVTVYEKDKTYSYDLKTSSTIQFSNGTLATC